ncbi:MAG: metallophosphoesterase [Bacteroidia bacterium]|nr:metallophosphoesterase [Bacteroidia bacterium]
MRKYLIMLLGAGILPALFSCAGPRPIYNHSTDGSWQQLSLPQARPEYTIFALGDAGDPDTLRMDSNFGTLRHRLAAAGSNSMLIFLGDNIYPAGLPHPSEGRRKEFEAHLDAQIAIADSFAGRTIFVPGNHDWDEGHVNGYIRAREEEKYIEEKMQNASVFYPEDACPGPQEIPLDSGITMIILNTQWWLHPYAKPDTGICPYGSDNLFLNEFENLMRKNAGKKVIVAAHHPMESQGPHGGKFPVTAHFFPLREFNRKLWIPLPVLGSIYVLFRKSGYIQDLTNKRYKQLQQRLESVMEQYPNTIYLNGHDHSLQYIPKNGVHYVTSGAGTESSHVVKHKRLHFGYPGRGHAEINIYPGNEVWLEFYRTDKSGKAEVLFRSKL